MAFQSPSCFVSIPFRPEFADVRATVLKVLLEMNVKPLQVSDLEADDSLSSGIADALRRADLILADITGLNAHVLYELGVAYGLNKPIAMIAQEGSDLAALPGDLAKQQIVTYPPGNVSSLVGYLHRKVRIILSSTRGSAG
jgi:hypothetical protein